jgi:hypothetical protein
MYDLTTDRILKTLMLIELVKIEQINSDENWEQTCQLNQAQYRQRLFCFCCLGLSIIWVTLSFTCISLRPPSEFQGN